MHRSLRFAVPLASAFLAAIAAHFAIDLAGDYVLPHDTYDDDAHGSRWLASLALAAFAAGVFLALARALLAETRGRRGALRGALRAAVPASGARFAVTVVATAFPLLLGMAWLDARCAGIRLDDFGALLGGSIPLGSAISIAFALAAACGAHRLVAFLARYHDSIVRLANAFARDRRPAIEGPLRATIVQHDRPHASAVLARCSGGNRAPPGMGLTTLLV